MSAWHWTGEWRPYLRYGDRGSLQNVSSPLLLFESSRFFYNTQETQTQKRMDQNFEIRILLFLRIFEIFKKASRGSSAADLDHYGRDQTRSEYRVLVTKFRKTG